MDVFGLKKKTAEKYIKNCLDNPVVKNKNEAGKIQSVGVIAEIGLFLNYDFTSKLVKELGLMPHQFRVALLDPFSKEPNAMDEYEVFNEKSFGLYGKIKSPSLEDFVSREFDLLINYSNLDWVFSEVVLLRSKAKLIAGFDLEGKKFHDISIHIPGNRMDDFHKELFKYLKIMQFT